MNTDSTTASAELTAAQIRFPAIFFEGGFVTQISGPIGRGNRLGLKKSARFPEQPIIIDANGNSFRILKRQKKRMLFPWRIGEIIGFLEANPMYEVELTFAALPKISLDNVKDLFLRCFKKQGDYWEEMSDFDEFRAELVAVDSFEQLFVVLREFHVIS